jgi:3-oxoadipate enol-lactonase
MPSRQFGKIRLYYEIDGQGEPVLFLHGLGSSARDWVHQASVFAAQYRVVIPELRGHGRSDKPPGPYSMALFANDIAALIRALRIAPVHVVGLSLGGFVACQLVVDHRDLVRSLVLVNSAPGLPRHSLQERSRLAWNLLLRRLIVRLFGMRALGRVLGRRLFPRPDQTELKRTFIERWGENQPDAYLASLAAVSDWGVEDHLDAMRCPVCVIAGEQDFIPLAFKETYTRKLAHAELIVIPNSGHLTPMDNPEPFNRALLAFLQRPG